MQGRIRNMIFILLRVWWYVRHLHGMLAKSSGRASVYFKRKLMSKIASDNNIKVFIETGTYLGDTVYYHKNRFEMLYTIEIDSNLYGSAKSRFENVNNIVLMHGDSRYLISGILEGVSDKALVWLDGHNNEYLYDDAPLLAEIELCLRMLPKGSVVLIDDYDYCGSIKGYPEKIQVEDLVRKYSGSICYYKTIAMIR